MGPLDTTSAIARTRILSREDVRVFGATMPDQLLLLIADIGGYTRFLQQHKFALAHAQELGCAPCPGGCRCGRMQVRADAGEGCEPGLDPSDVTRP
ncbi:MAG: hypothetical protein ACT4TC_25935 [Myxococcaceae bacterium]